MNTRNVFLMAGKTKWMPGVLVAFTLAGGAAFVEEARAGIDITVPGVNVTIGTPDNYVFYPAYGCYYNTTRHVFVCLDGGAWVTRPAPIGISPDVVLASPSVHMDFHDSPAHHPEIVRQYPKTWRGGAHADDKTHSDRPADHKDEIKPDQRDQHDVKPDQHDTHDDHSAHDDHNN
jgi:hypothetical protein